MSELERATLGWLDTTIFIHPLYENDEHRETCLNILRAIDEQRAIAWVDVIVIHELTYVLRRTNKLFEDRQEVLNYILGYLQMDSLRAKDKDLLINTLTRWAGSHVSFADARLHALAESTGLPVCSVNDRDFQTARNVYSEMPVVSLLEDEASVRDRPRHS